MAVPTGFEPALSALTGPRVWPGYTTGPAAAKSTNGLECCFEPLRRLRRDLRRERGGLTRPQTYNSLRRERQRPRNIRLAGRAAEALPDPGARRDLLHAPRQHPPRTGPPPGAGFGRQ